MHNTIFLKGGTTVQIRQALQDWMEESSDFVETGYVFELYKTADDEHVIKADDRLVNEQFNYLVNYLTYPIDIDYKLRATGYAKITPPTVYPEELTGEEVMIFIPESDNEHDLVYWMTSDEKVFKTDWDGTTREAGIRKAYESPVFDPDTFPLPEVFHSVQEKKVPIGNTRAFQIIVILIAVVLLIWYIGYKNRPE